MMRVGHNNSVSSVQSPDRLACRGHEGPFRRNPLPVFLAGGPCEQFWHWQRCPLFDVVQPAFCLPSLASPILLGALKDGFGEAVVAYDMPEPTDLEVARTVQVSVS